MCYFWSLTRHAGSRGPAPPSCLSVAHFWIKCTGCDGQGRRKKQPGRSGLRSFLLLLASVERHSLGHGSTPLVFPYFLCTGVMYVNHPNMLNLYCSSQMVIYFISGWSLHETLTGHICSVPQVTEISLGAPHHSQSFFLFVFFASEQLHGHLLWASEKDWVSVSNTHTIRQVSGLPVFHKRERDGLQTARHVGLQAKIEYCTTSESQPVAVPCEYKSTLWLLLSLLEADVWYASLSEAKLPVMTEVKMTLWPRI